MQLSAIKQMEQSARENPQIISLAQGMPQAFSDPQLRETVIQSILDDKVDYYSDPQGILPIREAIAETLQRDSFFYDAREILMTVGAVEAMASTLLALVSPGDEVLIPSPTYTSFFQAVKTAHAIPVSLLLQEETGWSLSLETVRAAITKKTKAIILCNPNNPTGTFYSERELYEICSLAKSHNLFIILDEVYRQMNYTNTVPYSPASVSDFREILIRIVSFSKDYSLTGWRIAFLHTDKVLLDRIVPVHDTLVNCAPVVSQYAASAALQLPDTYLKQKTNDYQKNRDLMGSYLEMLSDIFSFQYPEATYFFFPKIRIPIESKTFCTELLIKTQVAVVPGSAFGIGGESHIRLCFGRSTEQITEAMERILRYTKSL